MIIIRNEVPEDYNNIYAFTKEVFSTAAVSDGTEQDFVNTIREGKGYLQKYAFVMEKDDELIGHIMLSKINIRAQNGTNKEILLLAPLSIKLEERGKGYGAMLVRFAIDEAKNEIEYPGIVLVGDPAYYQRFGFKLLTKFQTITAADNFPSEYTLILPFNNKTMPEGKIIL